MDEQLRNEFLAEAEELIEALFSDLRELRERHAEGRARRELVGRIFRHAHTLKGAAAVVGLNAIGEIAHEFETLLDALRLGRITVDAAALDAFDEAAQAMSQALSEVARGQEPAARTALGERLRHLALPQSSRAEPQQASWLATLPDDIAHSLSEHEQQRLREAEQEGARLSVITVGFALDSFEERFRSLSAALAEAGEVISTMPGVEASAPDQITFRLVYAAQESPAETLARVAPFGALLTAGGAPEAQPEDAEEESFGEVASESAQPETYISAGALTTLVRVPLDELDELISATHELATDSAAALDFTLATDLTRRERVELELRAARLRRRFFELEERLIELRMVPVGQTLLRARRAGELAARAAGKEVEIEMAGEDVRLDKSLADAVADPLLHLLRNAADHGIEDTEERRRAGKAKRGRIRLEAIAEGSRVLVRVADDGRGIDPERIRRAAIERGLIAPDARLDEQQHLRLIFRPGFSTAENVSAVSGRGVGLDVVERAVESAGGSLRVRSELGKGTTFEMRLPTTLALVPSLIVRSAGYRYCLDASHVTEAGYLVPANTERIGASQAARWRGALLPLISLRELLAQPARSESEAASPRIPIVISRMAGRDGEEEEGKRVAVALDEWEGQSEVLVRGLGRHATRWRGISGATELRDGTVALMLDLPLLLEMRL